MKMSLSQKAKYLGTKEKKVCKYLGIKEKDLKKIFMLPPEKAKEILVKNIHHAQKYAATNGLKRNL